MFEWFKFWNKNKVSKKSTIITPINDHTSYVSDKKQHVFEDRYISSIPDSTGYVDDILIVAAQVAEIFIESNSAVDLDSGSDSSSDFNGDGGSSGGGGASGDW